ncbi:MAG: hypothetical protein RQ753_09795 [Desulfurivibrionaceae bacterium]|nr:hypothetical protein [Desulfurivibrionaceae bacterium]
MKKRLTALAVATPFLLMATLVPAGQDCGERLREKCTTCHYNTRICEKVGTKNRRAWKNSTKRMIRYGLKISNAEIDGITECLVSLEGNPDIFCAE